MGNTMDKSDFVGLENQGATCYLNTLLQTWFMTPEVRECITSAKSDAALVCVLQDLFNNLEGSENTSLRTDELTTLLRMNVYQQHDIEECFRNMINKLHTAMEPEQNILKFYQINMVQSLKCSWCTSHIQIDCPFLDLPLLIHSANSSRKFEHLEMALREFLKEQTMEDDNACYCDNCDTKTKTKTRYYFNHLPRILTFQLKRVNIDGFRMRYQKINDYVTLPLSIEFNKSQDNCNEWILKATRGKENDVQNTHCPESTDRGQSFAPTQAMQAGDAVDGEGRNVEAVQDQSDQDSSEEKEKKYELFAIWHHVEGFGGGHYYAEIKSVADGNWYCFNDRTVKQRGKDISLRSKTAYLIMYRVPETNSISGLQLKTQMTLDNPCSSPLQD